MTIRKLPAVDDRVETGSVQFRDLVERESPHADDCRLGEFTRSVDADGNAETFPCTCDTDDNER